MKKLFTILLVVAGICSVNAQSYPSPLPGSQLTNLQPYAVIGFIRTNPGINAAKIIPVGPNGVTLFATVGATNALTVTNCVATYEAIVGSETNGLTAPTFSWSFPINGTSAGRYATNIPATSPNFVNLRGLRLLHITNVNTETIWFTNLGWSIR